MYGELCWICSPWGDSLPFKQTEIEKKSGWSGAASLSSEGLIRIEPGAVRRRAPATAGGRAAGAAGLVWDAADRIGRKGDPTLGVGGMDPAPRAGSAADEVPGPSRWPGTRAPPPKPCPARSS